MKRGAMTIIAASLLLSAAACTSPVTPSTHADQTTTSAASAERETFDREERCGRTAREWFKEGWGDGHSNSGGVESNSYFENHYNAQHRKCYVLTGMSTFSKDARTGKPTQSEVKTLTDINDNFTQGTYLTNSDPPRLVTCLMDGTRCKSTDEWNAWTMQYMER